MNYSKLLTNLLREAISFKNRKVPIFVQVLFLLIILPYVIGYLFRVLEFYIADFIYQGLAAPFDMVYNFVKKEKEGAQDWSHAAICLSSMPLLVAYQFIIAMFSFGLYVLWFLLMIDTFIITLGGVRWQPYIHKASFDHVDQPTASNSNSEGKKETSTETPAEDETEAEEEIDNYPKDLLIEQLEFALQFETLHEMVTYLSAIKDKRTQEIIKAPRHTIKNLVTEYLNELKN